MDNDAPHNNCSSHHKIPTTPLRDDEPPTSSRSVAACPTTSPLPYKDHPRPHRSLPVLRIASSCATTVSSLTSNKDESTSQPSCPQPNPAPGNAWRR